jgi:uracil-DNA glycosylase
MTMTIFNLNQVDGGWQPILTHALSSMDPDYLQQLEKTQAWLPGPDKIFNAFKRPLKGTRYILLGESPYPRAASANGFAFWDAAVENIWSDTGMSSAVNRATSLRNIIKMLLLANGTLTNEDCSQAAIAELDKTGWISTLAELFMNLQDDGFLLLNASLVLSERSVRKESRYWEAFMRSLLRQILAYNDSIQLILLGKFAEKIPQLVACPTKNLVIAEHPYNLSFINNQNIQAFFKPFNLLKKRDKMLF